MRDAGNTIKRKEVFRMIVKKKDGESVEAMIKRFHYSTRDIVNEIKLKRYHIKKKDIKKLMGRLPS